jgi:protein-tyrosine-phosphatase/Co/Zn/Cd efflux system component
MAEGWARKLLPDWQAFSAGSKPRGSVDVNAVAVMQEAGIDITGQSSKGFEGLRSGDTIPNRGGSGHVPSEFDYVVLMGCKDACPFVPAKQTLVWDIPDPAGKVIDSYRQARDLIRDNLNDLANQPLAGACCAEPGCANHAAETSGLRQGLSAQDARRLGRQALLLSWLTVGYNILEGVASLIAGGLAGSIALTGFGLDSFIESLSGGIMIWRFSQHGKLTGEQEERIEQKAARLVAITFFILAAYVLYESARKLILREPPEPSLFGIIIAVTSLIAMPLLYVAKTRVGRALGSRSLVADSRQTLACMFLSVGLLIGLGANYLFRFWPADALVGLLVFGYLVKEGWDAWRKKELCSC